MQSLDTNIILRLLLNDVPEQTLKINDLIEHSDSGGLVIADAVLFEAVWILSGPQYLLSRTSIGRALLKITGTPQFKCNRPLIAKTLNLYINNPKLSYIDVCLVFYAEQNDAEPLITFDKNLAKTLPSAQLLT